MSENESRPLERWSASVGPIHAYKPHTTVISRESLDLYAKAAAMDRTLASWGMTWEEYQRKGEECSQSGNT